MQPAVHRDDLAGGFAETLRYQQEIRFRLIGWSNRGLGQSAVGVKLGELRHERSGGFIVRVRNVIFRQGPNHTIAREHGAALHDGGRGHATDADERGEFDGFSAVAHDTEGSAFSAAVVCRKDVTGDCQRLTLAHELAHLVLRGGNNTQSKKLAYRFGAAFLVPREPLVREVGEKRTSLNVNELLLLKGRFGVSVQALIRRMRELEGLP